MKRYYALGLLFCASLAYGQTAVLPVYDCVQNGIQAKTSGLLSSNYLQGVVPYCNIVVYLTGTTTIATTSPQTPLTANANGSIPPIYAAVNQGYDIVLSGGIYPNVYTSPVTLTGVMVGGGCPTTGCTFTGPVQDGYTVLPNQVNPAAFGTVDPTGVLDSSAAFQAAINSKEPINVPFGTYSICGLLVPAQGMQLIGPNNSRQTVGGTATKTELICPSGDMFVPATPGQSTENMSVSGFEIWSPNGNVFNFTGSNVLFLDLYNLYAWMSGSPTYSFFKTDSGCQECLIDNIRVGSSSGNSASAIAVENTVNSGAGGNGPISITNSNFSAYTPVVSVSNCQSTGGVATLSTADTKYLVPGAMVTLAGFTTCTELNGTILPVSAVNSNSNIQVADASAHSSAAETATATATSTAPAISLSTIASVGNCVGSVLMKNIVFENQKYGAVNSRCIGNSELNALSNDDVTGSSMSAPFITVGVGDLIPTPPKYSYNVKITNSSETFGSASNPSVTCPAGVCEFQNSFLAAVSLGGAVLDPRAIYDYSPNWDYNPWEWTDAMTAGVWSTEDGFSGGGMTGNLVTGSDGLTTNWNSYSLGTGSITGVAPNQPDPVGGSSALTATFNVSGTGGAAEYRTNAITVAPGIYTNSVWVKSCSGTAQFVIYVNGVGWGQQYFPYTATTTWQRFYSTGLISGTTAKIYIGVTDSANIPLPASSCLVMYGEQLTPSQAIHPYVSTTYAGAAVPIAPMSVINGKPVAFGTVFSALTGDATSTSTGGATTVAGLKNVPFCTGYTPTTGQVIEYTTGSSPNPCYTAAATSGSGTVTTSGSPVSGNIAAFSGATAITAATSAQVQTAIGAGVYDAFGAAAAKAALTGATFTGPVNVPATSQTGVNFFGDSILAAAQGLTPYFQYGFATQFSLDTGYTPYIYAVGGNTSGNICVRQGGCTPFMTIPSGNIPACAVSGSCTGVTVTFPTGYEPVTAQGPVGGTPGVVAGVPGQVTLSSGTYTFTRSLAGSIVTTGGANFSSTWAAYPSNDQVLEAGANNYQSTAQILSDYESMAAKNAALGAHSVILSVIPQDANYEWYGGVYGHYFPDINNQLASVFSMPNVYDGEYADVLSALIAYACASPYITDQSDCTHHEPATSQRAVLATCTTTADLASGGTSVPITCTAVASAGFSGGTTIATFEPTTSNADKAQISGVSGSNPNYTLTLVRGYGGNQTSHTSGAAVSITDPIHFGIPVGWTQGTPMVWNTFAPTIEAAYQLAATTVAAVGSTPSRPNFQNLNALTLSVCNYYNPCATITQNPDSSLQINEDVHSSGSYYVTGANQFLLGTNGWFIGATDGRVIIGNNSSNTGSHANLTETAGGQWQTNAGFVVSPATDLDSAFYAYNNGYFLQNVSAKGNMYVYSGHTYGTTIVGGSNTAARQLTLPDFDLAIGTWAGATIPTYVSGTPFLKMTAQNVWALDTNTYVSALQTNSTNNTSQTALNFITSTVNATGLTVTPSNPATSSEKMEVTGTLTSGYGGTGTTTLTGIRYATSGSADTAATAAQVVAVISTTAVANATTAASANAVNSNTFPASAGFTSGGIPYYSSTSAEASSALLTHYGLIYGGGAAGAPVSIAACGANFPVVGSATAPACSTIGWLASATQWGIPYMSTATQMSTTGALTQYGVLLGGGSATAPTATAADTTTTHALFATATAPAFRALAAGDIPAAAVPATPSTFGTGTTLTGPFEDYFCTGTCTPTLPVPPSAGTSYEFCIFNDMGVSTSITMQAIGSGVMYPKGDFTGWGTAGTGTFTMTAAAGNRVCFVSKDATHYNLASINGAGTAS